MRRFSCTIVALTLVLLSAVGCTADSVSTGTLTPIANDDLRSVYDEIFSQDIGMLPSAVTEAQVDAGDATGWQYLLQEDAAPRVQLDIYEKGVLTDTVTVLPGNAGLSGTILFGASQSESGWIWATDLEDGGNLQSHRYTYQDTTLGEPRRLAAGTIDLHSGEETWLAALLYDLPDGYAPTDIAALQEEGLGKIPLAAVLSIAFGDPTEVA